MLQTASKHLCEKLQAVSGWSDTYAVFRYVGVDHYEPAARMPELDSPDLVAAYDLNYLIDKLPPNIQIDETMGWLMIAKNVKGFQAGYLMELGYMETKFDMESNCAADAMCMVAIEMFKRKGFEWMRK